VSECISRLFAAVRRISHMVYPDDAQLRRASEITFRTRLAGLCSRAIARQDRKAQVRLVRQIGPKLGADLPRALAEPASTRPFTFCVRPRAASKYLAFSGYMNRA
jgi:hypothetical protein